jgi:hypothetical protein
MDLPSCRLKVLLHSNERAWMFFAGLRTSAELSLTTPLDFCCNCGSGKRMDLVEMPLQKTRFFLFFGTELTLKETFPYCRRNCSDIGLFLYPGVGP